MWNIKHGREITIVALMIVAAIGFWFAGVQGLIKPDEIVEPEVKGWFGFLVPAEVYYQTAVVIITMYILLVAFRAERFVRRTSYEEELSLELAQKISEIKGSAAMDVKKSDFRVGTSNTRN